MIDLLIATWPEAAAEQDPDGNSPLHFAAACQQTPDVVKSLIAACPDAAKWRGQLKRYPLSLCLLTEAPPESVELIRDAYPDAVRAHEIVADYQNHGEERARSGRRPRSARTRTKKDEGGLAFAAYNQSPLIRGLSSSTKAI